MCLMLAPTRIAALTCALALTTPALAADIYKCVRGDATSYQATPCAGGQAETLLLAVVRKRGRSCTPRW